MSTTGGDPPPQRAVTFAIPPIPTETMTSIAFLITAGSNGAFGQIRFSNYEHANGSKVAPSSLGTKA